jgi:uncharacterized membrane protein
MSQREPGWTDEGMGQVIGNLLRVGVAASALVVLAGGALYLIRHGTEHCDYSQFRPNEAFQGPRKVVRAALTLSGRGLIQLGVLLLIATPVARVAFSVFAFARRRDYTYVAITLIVLAVLLCGLFWEHFKGLLHRLFSG